MRPVKPTLFRVTTGLLLFAALLLRVAVPQGLMPDDDGWFLKICPDGLPAQVAAIFGDEHAHHHMADEAGSYVDCELSTTGTVALGWTTMALDLKDDQLSDTRPDLPATDLLAQVWIAKSPRAPPAHSRST